MAGLFFSKKTVIPLSLVIDIESGSVGAALFVKQKNGKPILLHTDRESVPFPRHSNSRFLLHAMHASLERLLDHVVRDAVFDLNTTPTTRYRITSSDAVISSPWYHSETRTVSLRFETPKVITEGLVHHAVSAEEQDFEASSEREPQSPYELVERKIMRVLLNGYPTTAPYGKKALSVDCAIACAIAPRSFLDSVRTLVGRYLPDVAVRFHTFMLTAFATIRDEIPERDDFILLHVGGEVSDALVVRNGIISDMVSFPMGQNTLTRNTVKFFTGSPHASVESLLKLSSERAVGMKDRARIDHAVEAAREAWLKLFFDALAGLSGAVFLPRQVLLLDSGPHAKMFEGFLGSADWRRVSAGNEKFSVMLMSTRESDHFSERAQGIIGDVPLSIQTNFLSRFGSPASRELL